MSYIRRLVERDLITQGIQHMQLLVATILLSFTLLGLGQAPPAFRFQIDTLHEGIPQPMHLEHGPDGKIYFIEIAGKVQRFDLKSKSLTTLGKVVITNDQENGLIGMALDPDFASNQWIYLYHSPVDFKGQILSRFTITADKLDHASRIDILKVDEQRNQCCHHGGTIRFGRDGNLFISTGDNTSPFASNGFSPIDERKGREPFDAQKSSGNTNDLRGKILRIKVKPDGTYEIPKGNLFPEGMKKTRPEIFAMGFRNPWRFSVDPVTNWLYVGDVGPDSGKDDPNRGPRGHDILYQIRKAGNFGWPYVRAKKAYHDFDFATNKSGDAFDPKGPLNKSPNNTGLEKLPPVSDPLVYYPHAKVDQFSQLHSGGRTSCGGPVFHFKPEFKNTGGFPQYFDKAALHFDWQRPSLNWVRLDDQGNFSKLEPFTDAVKIGQGKDSPGQPMKIRRPADMIFGPDGALYILDYGETWGVNKDARLLRISYRWGELPPVVKASASPSASSAPLKVTLSAKGSFSPEKKTLSYKWTLFPSGTKLGSGETLTATIAEPGNHFARLTITDPDGGKASLEIPLTVGNAPPVVEAVHPTEGSLFKPGQKIPYQFKVTDAEEGSSETTPDNFSSRTLVTAKWIGHDGKNIASNPGLALMKQSDCFNCHAIDQKLVGPSLMEIAERYRGQKGAQLTATERVIKGSAGVWSELPMLPHPQHSMDEAHLMVSWIFSLDPKKPLTAMKRGLSGEITAPDNPNIGSCVIEATFTDFGKAPANPLTTFKTVSLLHHRIEAESGTLVGGTTLAAQNEASNGTSVNRIEPGRQVILPEFTAHGLSKVTVRATSGNDGGGTIEFRHGAKDGPLLATVKVNNTGGIKNYQTFSAAFKTPEKSGPIHLVFTHPKKGRLMFLDWVQFD
ncbi:MAG: PQQ-dependent sugar dehydrogenase [Akkermansiaceae bacterium]|nr:PQQ-dependent sugar dehydrogenase [Akkermansiaceae bacterium]